MDPEPAARRAFRENLVSHRSRRGLSQRGLVRELKERHGIGMTQSALARVEGGQRDPRLEEAVALSSILGFSLDGLSQHSQADELLTTAGDDLGALIAAAIKLRETLDAATEAFMLERGFLTKRAAEMSVVNELTGKKRLLVDYLQDLVRTTSEYEPLAPAVTLRPRARGFVDQDDAPY